MDAIALFIYLLFSIIVIIPSFYDQNYIYQAPFWFTLISLGWFFPQAVGGLNKVDIYPNNAYILGMIFATLCNISFYLGWYFSYHKKHNSNVLMDLQFDDYGLYRVGATLCLIGFYFQWKLWSLPEEILTSSTWSGIAVQYVFFSQVFKYGFLILWICYLRRGKWLSIEYLILILPCLLLILDAAIFRGRRAEMMNLVSYLIVGLWLVRGIKVPRLILVLLLGLGIIFINSIGVYRSIMKNENLTTVQKFEQAINADYLSANKASTRESGFEFDNYIYTRSAVGEDFDFDYGVFHWNRFVFNYIPAQLVGNDIKQSFMIDGLVDIQKKTIEKYGHSFNTGSTITGYADSFVSFGWLGFVKFLIAGLMSGWLSRHAQNNSFIGQLLFLFMLNYIMHVVTHNTNEFLVRQWVYFFVCVLPILFIVNRSYKIKFR
ncbi:hypothetical protein [Vibrio breoganii]|uniref:hypothetical protein n=1 Tax=Vibrio breoganii TaxID=553239 RepID=UPI000C867D24|nr:hypothetical protein [Vibrio breoganii]PMK26267.1 hypothetical protein BCU06_18525 [Vibrio breoganii]